MKKHPNIRTKEYITQELAEKTAWLKSRLKRRTVYVALLEESQIIKIGSTNNLERRIGQLRYSHREPISVLTSFRGSLHVEKRIHDQLGYIYNGRFGREYYPAGRKEVIGMIAGLMGNRRKFLSEFVHNWEASVTTHFLHPDTDEKTMCGGTMFPGTNIMESQDDVTCLRCLRMVGAYCPWKGHLTPRADNPATVGP